ncbi:MAG TPA: hypothetical protein VG963_25495 [Polyangiaceae bacterium]|nr:hypothetical protein [Polyangiaceae bacterium]
MMRLARKARSIQGVLLPWLMSCGSAESDSVHCAKLSAQIASELQSEVQRGTISSNAIACGQEGIVNHPDDFAPGTSPDDVERITTRFANQCTDLSSRCGGDAGPGSP